MTRPDTAPFGPYFRGCKNFKEGAQGEMTHFHIISTTSGQILMNLNFGDKDPKYM